MKAFIGVIGAAAVLYASGSIAQNRRHGKYKEENDDKGANRKKNRNAWRRLPPRLKRPR